MGDVRLKRLRFYTKDESELIHYKLKGNDVYLPQVFVYEHFGSKEEALEAFMPLGSFCMAETGDSFIAFPLKGAPKVRGFSVVLCRVENGKVYDLDDYCELCEHKLRKLLSGCGQFCDGLKGLPQRHPMVVKPMKSELQLAHHQGDKRSKKKRMYEHVDADRSALLV